VLDLPFADATFDCVWCANVAAYLTTTEFARVIGNFRRVTKPGGVVAVKDLDVTLLQFLPLPLDLSIPARVLDAWRTPSRGPFFRQAGFENIVRKSWLVERWAPPPPATRQFITMLLRFMAARAAEHDVPQADREALRAAAEEPDRLLDDPDFCFREAFVVTLGHVPA
jgi:SAM-dependent methyltransferase